MGSRGIYNENFLTTRTAFLILEPRKKDISQEEGT
jgi:hypothetical protein